MRVTLELTDLRFRRLKAQAAECKSLTALIDEFSESRRNAPSEPPSGDRRRIVHLPRKRLGRSLNLPEPSSAELFEALG